MDLPQDLISTEHAARLAKLHVSGIRRLIFAGRLRGWRLRPGRRWYVSRADLLQLWETSDELAARKHAERLPPRTARRRRDRQVAEELAKRGIKV